MKAGSGLASAPLAAPALAADAVRRAIAAAGGERPSRVFLFLSAHFARQAPRAIQAAAGAAGGLQVSGMLAEGVFTEAGWRLDQPAVAALVLGQAGAGPRPSLVQPQLAFCGGPAFPPPGADAAPRWGLTCRDALVWHDARLCAPPCAEIQIPGHALLGALSTGLHALGEAQEVTAVRGHDVLNLASASAADSLRRALPPGLRDRSPLPVHLVAACEDGLPPIPILTANGDGSLCLARPPRVGARLQWALRQPLTAAADMAASLESLAARCQNPACALVFSCIGRGPLFYDGEDRDLAALRRRFPGLPLAGAYGTGQIVPWNGGVAVLQNSVATVLFEPCHV
ncbi:MAG: FIST C-terminal domain-containing protein [Betaproteobacteria bacterium]|nr:FIST C-terminal domain-containing protein [Betaproteobacteria bacterium]